jgi:hypothetical protein
MRSFSAGGMTRNALVNRELWLQRLMELVFPIVMEE